ncbi:MAG: hypothetical protein IJU03_09145 [Thermoguttaceae bacterium]|nr:hypothetical protein [Thermoguttaceae bacterium]
MKLECYVLNVYPKEDYVRDGKTTLKHGDSDIERLTQRHSANLAFQSSLNHVGLSAC